MAQEFLIQGLGDELTAEVRQTLKSPEYGHPAIREVARGTGPCRACLDVFKVGSEERLLFTYRPPEGDGTLGASGPVFIHAEQCERYNGVSVPPGLRALPLLLEGRASGNRIIAARRATGAAIDEAVAELLGIPEVDFLYLRHGEAGCHIARVERQPAIKSA